MNPTAMLSRMFDRWYRRQIARQLLLDQVRLAGQRVDAVSPVPPRNGLVPDADRLNRPGPDIRRGR